MRFDSPTPDELALVYDSWARSFRKSPFAGCVPNHLWDQVSRACMSEILNRGARVIVAVVDLETDPPQRRVMGYSVSEPGPQVLHWLYVKDDYRGMGLQVGTKILRETIKDWDPRKRWTYTHRTNAAAPFLYAAAGGSTFTWDPVPARVKR